MAMNKEHVGQHKSRSVLALALLGLVLSAGGVLYWEPLLTLSQKSPDKISIFCPVYAYLFLLNPLNFYLNVLLSLLHVSDVMVDTGAAKASPSVFFIKKHLPWAAHSISSATLIFGTPLFMLAAVNEESIDLAVGAALVCVAIITILTPFLKKFLVCTGFVPALLALCISAGYLLSFDPFLSFSNKNHSHHGRHILVLLPLLFVSFVTFALSVLLVILRTGKPADKQHASIQAVNFVVTVLSVSIGVLLVSCYLKVCIAVTDMATFVVEAGEI